MKKMLITFGVTMVFSVCLNRAFAQETATATATATIVTPIAITKTADMNFGNVAVQSTTGGTVVLPPSATPTRTTTSGVTLPATVGTVTAAAFDVTGEDGYTYSITLPSSVTITSNSNSMTVNAFTSSPSGTGTLTSGAQTLYVGATLVVGAAQAAGTYVSTTPFNVTVNYN
ncbi:DUF4402 domain-containing protein [Chitinophaga tropicalis]|uniref:DUF4402 domain-containing protein n=1 Tax=Chitinophaga tropicalis TaxID=2683588 RepID=A0A7K1TZU2_9BACT|nr:DUF4402 domain-containing protein [Chitinophaga tropicalis]MVT07639.1 DUF4402 domain-containing protein [Chitinophaga tropicalis]